MTSSLVIAGLDPAIHSVSRPAPHFIMDARVEPAHDELSGLNRFPSNLNRNLGLRAAAQRIEKQRFFAVPRGRHFASHSLLLNQQAKR